MAPSDSNARLEADLRRQARHYARLSPEEESTLLGRRDADAVEALVEHNLDLVVSQAEAHDGRGLGFADLYQEGNVGLVDAIAAYDGNGDFREFASLHIGLQMDSLIESEATSRREAEADVEDSRALDLAQAAFRQRNGRPADDIEMAGILGWEVERIRKVRGMVDYARQQSDAATVDFLDDEKADQLGIDFLDDEPDEPERDPRRRPQGAGPDD